MLLENCQQLESEVLDLIGHLPNFEIERSCGDPTHEATLQRLTSSYRLLNSRTARRGALIALPQL